MKKARNITIIFLILCLYGCEYEKYRSFEESQVAIEKSNVIFTAAGGTGTIEIATSAQFTATVDQTWCKLSISGKIITVTVEPNRSALARSANVSIKSGDKINFVPVTQTPVYIHLDNYNPLIFSANGGTIAFPYESDASVTVKTGVAWLSGQVENGSVVLDAVQNTDSLKKRTAIVTLVAGNNLTSLDLNVIQNELMTIITPNPDVDAVSGFLNLKNNNGSSSRYKVTLLSPRLETLYANLKTAFPVFQEIRIEAPRSTHKTSIILVNSDGFYYLNCADGLVAVNNSKYVGVFRHSGNTYAGTEAPYTSNANYTALQAFFIQAGGFTIIQDQNNVFWFRSVADTNDWFKAEPAQW